MVASTVCIGQTRRVRGFGITVRIARRALAIFIYFARDEGGTLYNTPSMTQTW
jgi:hypothetical protein